MVSCLLAAGEGRRGAEQTAEVLLAADLGGIDSHGCARLRRYVEGLASGAIAAEAAIETVSATPATAALDANNGLGAPAAIEATEVAVAKAGAVGVGVVSVRRSNHFGIAGYYASRAARKGMIGLVLSNASPQVSPVFGAEPMFGTNPLAIGMPTGEGDGFLLDMATSTVGRGKLEVRQRRAEPIPEGWVIDASGAPRVDVEELIDGLKARRGYSLLPLGGSSEEFGAHKGYGLGLFADLVCGPLAGAAWGRHVYGPAGADLGHLIVAIQVEAFRDRAEFEAECRQMFAELRAARRAAGADRIFIPGEKEVEERERRLSDGIPLTEAVSADLAALAEQCGVPAPELR
jgi:L-2-hydroxycarboxylate dehydrogenase (NAD+)